MPNTKQKATAPATQPGYTFTDKMDVQFELSYPAAQGPRLALTMHSESPTGDGDKVVTIRTSNRQRIRDALTALLARLEAKSAKS